MEDGLLFVALAIVRVGVVGEVAVGGTRSMSRQYVLACRAWCSHWRKALQKVSVW
jgi:hypothetical protein